ncbi:MAG TPA: aldehyde ferredoxin oxidoreductase N-terminal domain-containing protein, partial [Telmatospirillum sp.]|nr:aldehyde ferredoxin oxidoreductase N-terminal domain-containing protein [Telmatospirillum sp.]
MDKILRVDMAKMSVKIEPVPEAWAAFGGRALTSTVVATEVPPTCHPLGPSNKLVFAPGLLSGTAAACSGRLSVGSKSPLTGTIKECNVGGTAGRLLGNIGIKALIIEGVPSDDAWYNLHIDKDGVRISKETEFLGLGNFALVEAVENRCGGKRIGVIGIGPAGEMKMAAANISVKDPDSHIRSAGRGGLGAVLGSKRIKFISIDDTDAPRTGPMV